MSISGLRPECIYLLDCHRERSRSFLADMVNQLRKVRNLGAHDTKDIVTEEDIPLILSLLEAILEYLYVAPAKLKKLKEKLGKAS